MKQQDRGFEITKKNWRETVDGDDRGTVEALQHRGLERVTTQIDGKERVVNRTITTIRSLHSAGSISDGMYRIGEVFQQNFAIAQLDALRAIDLQRVGGGGYRGQRIEADSVIAARDVCYDMFRVVGGEASVMGRALWHIVGCDCSLRDMEQNGKGNRHFWKGVLICTLQLLEQAEEF